MKNYTLIKTEELNEIGSVGYLYEHNKTKARVVYIKNDDDNKVFYIGFRTPPADSTGVAHITEHSVLCGSDKYPVKDPFVELAKGSLNTFLNAMTYPDKTVYPVASTNDKDFDNLVDIYLDAVFHPNIYKHEEIFMQEGWHYEMTEPDGELTINGVVYNEMKGAFSSPEDVLEREILNSLFPDNTYSIESGGDPKVIPELTYQGFLDFHKKYYHPSNSYIYFYGDMDIEEKLNKLDEEYLSNYDFLQVDSAIELQKPFDKLKRINKKYSASMEDEEAKSYLAYNICCGDCMDFDTGVALEILDYALLNAPGAPLKQALIDAGICEDVSGGYSDGVRQVYYSVIAKGADAADADKFYEIVRNVLEDQISNGINRDSLRADINRSQFKIKEADFGSYPKGLIWGLSLLDSWLYDDEMAFEMAKGNIYLEKMKERLDTGYFEEVVKRCLYDNTHATLLVVEPEAGLTAKDDEALRLKLEELKNSMTADARQTIVDNTAHLKEYQETPSSQEDLEKIPLLSRSDLRRESRPVDLEVTEYKGYTLLKHPMNTNGINYLILSFDVTGVTLEQVHYLGLLGKLIGLVDTKNYGYKDLANEILMNVGGINIEAESRRVCGSSKEQVVTRYEVRAKFLNSQKEKAYELIRELISYSDFSDKKRVKELVTRIKVGLDTYFASAGHALARNTLGKNVSRMAVIGEHLKGYDFYLFIKALEKDFDNRFEEMTAELKKVYEQIFTKDKLLVSITGEDDAVDIAREFIDRFDAELPVADSFGEEKIFELKPENLGIKDAAMIQYVCRGGSVDSDKYQYTGAYHVLKTILSYDYFWINVRVKGGAYGCMTSFSRHMDMSFVSYRDPNLTETIEVFNNTPDYIRNFDVSERDMTKFIIGTIGGLDTPLTPAARGMRGYAAYLTCVTNEMLNRERAQIVDADIEDIRALADPVEAVLAQNMVTVVGNEENIEANKDIFDRVYTR